MLPAVLSDIRHSSSVGMTPLGVEISQQPMHSDGSKDDERHDVGHETYDAEPKTDRLTRTDSQAIDDAWRRDGGIGQQVWLFPCRFEQGH